MSIRNIGYQSTYNQRTSNNNTKTACSNSSSTQSAQQDNTENIKYNIAKYSNHKTSSNYLLDRLLDDQKTKSSSDVEKAKSGFEDEIDAPQNLKLEDDPKALQKASEAVKQTFFNPFDLMNYKSQKPANSGFNLLRTYKPGDLLRSTLKSANNNVEDADDTDDNFNFLSLTLGERLSKKN